MCLRTLSLIQDISIGVYFAYTLSNYTFCNSLMMYHFQTALNILQKCIFETFT